MSYAIESIAKSIGARRVGKHKATIDWLLTDSRSLSFPEETLFFALTTKRNSGARYIPDLYDRGVRNFVITEEDFKEVENGELRVESEKTVNIPHNWDDYYGYRQLTHGNLHGTVLYKKDFILNNSQFSTLNSQLPHRSQSSESFAEAC